eukprot:1157512-Pelagomonas_calceolata.AAC.11
MSSLVTYANGCYLDAANTCSALPNACITHACARAHTPGRLAAPSSALPQPAHWRSAWPLPPPPGARFSRSQQQRRLAAQLYKRAEVGIGLNAQSKAEWRAVDMLELNKQDGEGEN